MTGDETAKSPKVWLPGEAPSNDDPRLYAPAAARNLDPIRTTLRAVLGEADLTSGHILELASGSGEHAVAFSDALPGFTWQPSERDPAGLASIAAWQAAEGGANLKPPVRIDLGEQDWMSAVSDRPDVVLAVNLLHIAPWLVTENLIAGAAGLLSPAGLVIVYGPFSRDGDLVSDGNRDFDATLRARDPDWGIRDTRDIRDLAGAHGLAVRQVIAMPANNTMLVIGGTAD